jgi:spoIIIJ-associated protein
MHEGSDLVAEAARRERARLVVNSAEASGRTLEAAVAAAAAKLGLTSDQVAVDVLEQAIPSTFGRIGSPARVRVTPLLESSAPVRSPGRADREQVGSVAHATPLDAHATPAATAPLGTSRGTKDVLPEVEATDRQIVEADTELAADFIEGFLDVLDLDGDITTWVDAQGGHVDIEGRDLDVLVGTDGVTLSALQELARLAVLRQTRHRVRITVDVDGFKARRRDELAAAARAAAERVLDTGEVEELQPMPAFERKLVHDVVASMTGLQSESLGEEPNRRVLIRRL